MRSKHSVKYICIIIIFLFTIFSNISIAQENELNIYITDEDSNEISEIVELEKFIISIYTVNDSIGIQWLIDVDIEFDGTHYTIDNDAEIELQAPKVDSDRIFKIIANKDLYNSSEKNITILENISKKLVISSDDVVEGGKYFTVYVEDEDNNPIEGAIIGLQNNWDQKEETNNEGKAFLKAPEDQETIKIIAQKDPFISDSKIIRVNIPQAWWKTLINSWYFPILIATIVLILIIIFVNHQQKKSIYHRSKEITDKQKQKKYEEINLDKIKSKEQEDEYYNTKPIRSKKQKDSKVEEIRISRPRKDKEIIPVKEQDETEKVIERKKNKKNNFDWFEGTEDVRYEIDKLTGEIDEEGVDKWFEGVDGLKEKISEKVKKKDNKKDDDEDK